MFHQNELLTKGSITRLYYNMRNELAFLAFCEGLLATHHISFFLIYVQHYHISILAYAVLQSFLSIIVLLNPLLGYISDNYSVLGRKKKSYMVILGLVGFLCYFLCGMISVLDFPIYIIFILHFIIDASNAFRTVIIDSICVIIHNLQKLILRPGEQKSSTSKVTLLFISRLSGKILSNILFGVLFQYFQEKCLVNSLVYCERGLSDQFSHWVFFCKSQRFQVKLKATSIQFKENVAIALLTIRKNNLKNLLFSNGSIKMSPSFATPLNYFLKNILFFTSIQFGLKQLVAELSFLLGIIFLNWIFRIFKRSNILKYNCFSYTLTNLFLIPLLIIIQYASRAPGLPLILLYTGLHSFFYEVFYLPIMSIFLEVCPLGHEGFFMSTIIFFNNFSINVGNFLGTICIYMFNVTQTNFNNIYYIIVLNFLFNFTGFVILMKSHIPEKPQIQINEEVSQIENNHLAFINTEKSIIFEEENKLSKEIEILSRSQNEKSKQPQIRIGFHDESIN